MSYQWQSLLLHYYYFYYEEYVNHCSPQLSESLIRPTLHCGMLFQLWPPWQELRRSRFCLWDLGCHMNHSQRMSPSLWRDEDYRADHGAPIFFLAFLLQNLLPDKHTKQQMVIYSCRIDDIITYFPVLQPYF